MSFSYKVLVYESDQRVCHKLASLARQCGMEPIEANTPAAAETAAGKHYLELALVNATAPRITLKTETKRVALGYTSAATSENMLFYQPEAVIPYPVDDPAAVFILLAVSGITPHVPALPCNLVELSAILKEHLFRIDTLLQLADSRSDLAYSAEEYCHHHCSFAKPSSELSREEVSEYKVIFASSGRGHLMCKYKPTCMLHRMVPFLKDKDPDIATLSPAEVLGRAEDAPRSTSMVDAIRTSYEAYDRWAERLLTQRTAHCDANCFIPDDKGIIGTKIKQHCCGFGCVLDNYFDLSPEKTYLTSAKAIIYENNPKDAKILEFLCREFRMEPVIVTTRQEVERLITSGKYDFAIVNPELEPVAFPRRTKVIIVDQMSVALIARVLAYKPVSIIVKPFDVAKLSVGFIRALGLAFNQTSLLASINNLSMALRSFETALNNWLIEEYNKYALPESVQHFCENRCPAATLKENIPSDDLGKYHLLNPFSKRGALYCRVKPSCKLWALLEHAKASAAPETLQAPADFLRARRQIAPGVSMLRSLLNFTDELSGRLDALDGVRKAYCTGICPHKKDDINAKKGDILFSSFEESLTRNAFTYCQQHECPVMLFFEYFRRVLL